MMYNKRKDKRYPCICLSVLYSPLANANVSNLAESYLRASSHDMSVSGMSFDVTTSFKEGERLVIAIPNEKDTHDEISAIVRWCSVVSEGLYRLGVVFDINGGINREQNIADSQHILHGPGIPVEASLDCPACKQMTEFTYKGMQKCLDGDGDLPLYDCGSCGTTRSITSLLEYNRK